MNLWFNLSRYVSIFRFEKIINCTIKLPVGFINRCDQRLLWDVCRSCCIVYNTNGSCREKSNSKSFNASPMIILIVYFLDCVGDILKKMRSSQHNLALLPKITYIYRMLNKKYPTLVDHPS